MKPAIVLNQKMMPSLEAELDRAYAVHRIAGRSDLAAVPDAVRGSIRAIVTGGSTGAAPELLEALPALEIVAVNGVGTDAVDLAARQGTGRARDQHPGRAHGRCRRHGVGPHSGHAAPDLRR